MVSAKPFDTYPSIGPVVCIGINLNVAVLLTVSSIVSRMTRGSALFSFKAFLYCSLIVASSFFVPCHSRKRTMPITTVAIRAAIKMNVDFFMALLYLHRYLSVRGEHCHSPAFSFQSQFCQKRNPLVVVSCLSIRQLGMRLSSGRQA